ncbi:MAG: hypothetical protein QOE26_2781 [Verrucomicrobiota bacterium]|jgi:hypothetical protein
MTFLKTFWAAFLAVVAGAALAGLVFTMVRGSNDRRQVTSYLDKAIATPSPGSQGSQVRIKRDVTVQTSSGSEKIAEGTWLYLQGESPGIFTCYYQGQQIQVPKADAEIVTWK